MRKKDRVIYISSFLNKLYPNPKIPLDHVNTFTFLVAVVLSAQSTDKKVNELTKALFKVANKPLDMCNIGENAIYQHIKQLGLARTKAKHIFNLSRILIDKYEGIIPTNFKDLESLPGVGHKTASVLMAQAFGVPTFPVDTHIHRLAQRWGLSNGKNVLQTEMDLKLLFPIDIWNKLHLQIIYYGREYCSAKGCDGRICHLCATLYPSRTKPFVHKLP